ncbi:MAG: hypothetical protein K9H16_15145 [Bacteroidales bacterium]|nr:hypothetical protein [Bacteroidales bacterium]
MKAASTYTLSRVLFLLLVAMLWTPAIQMQTGLVSERDLNGAIEVVEKTPLTVDSWFDETFQQAAEKYLNQNFGFRNAMVRIYNQMAFWMYKKSTAKNVVVGKEYYLFEKNYIEGYYGRDFIGDSLLHERVRKLAFLHDTLASSGITLIVAMAPDKAWFYPEYIPDYLRGQHHTTNYEVFLREANQQGLNLIDFNSWLLSMKDSSSYPLYPKTGIHWSSFGMNLSLDSLLKYIETKRNIDIPDYIVGDYELSRDYRGTDTDIEKGMNLLFPIDNIPMPYADFEVENSKKSKPKFMVVSDSFFWNIYGVGVMYSVFNDGEFWYYNKQIFKPTDYILNKHEYVDDVDVYEKIMDKDVILLMCSPVQLRNFPWNFDELAVASITKRKKMEIGKIAKTISDSKEWMETIVKKANLRNISIDSMIKLDANYIYELKLKEQNNQMK